jgi:competence protein ComEA
MKGFIKPLIIAASMLTLPAFAGQPVNVNNADAQQLAESLDGVGMSKAVAIIEYRDSHGPFQHADELVNVKGIGLRTVEKNRDYIQLEKKADAQPGKARKS